jgi:hypothetical protein
MPPTCNQIDIHARENLITLTICYKLDRTPARRSDSIQCVLKHWHLLINTS